MGGVEHQAKESADPWCGGPVPGAAVRSAAVDVAAVGGAVEDPFVASLDAGGGRRGHGMPAEAKAAAAALVLATGQVLPLRTAFMLPAASLLLLLPTSLLVLAWLRWC